MTLELSNVSITLGGRQLVKGLDLKLAPGEVVGLLGPNGAGKTTTFNLVIGLLSPDQGEVTVNGERVTHLPMPERARLGVGYLPQEASVFRNLTVRENLDIALEQTDLSSEQRRDRRQQLIEDFHLSAFINRLGFQLSGGNVAVAKWPGHWHRVPTDRRICFWMNPLPASTPLRWRICSC